MNVLCLLDIPLYQSFLKKFFLSRDIAFDFVPPRAGQVRELMAARPPQVVLVQDSYGEARSESVYAEVRQAVDALGGKTRVMLLCTAADGACRPDFEEILAISDAIRVTRRDIEAAFDALLADEARLEPEREEATRIRPRKRILFVETSKTMHRLLTAAFEQGPYRILHARDGEEALAAYRAQAPDLVLTGIQLPKLGGLELCKRIKQENTERYIPVIAFSSSDDPLDIATAFDCGVDDYILKSSAMDRIMAKVEEHLGALDRRRRSKILCLDDSKVIRELLRHSLIRNGLNAILAGDGREALRIAQNEMPEVVVADLGAPGLGGYELCEAIRERPELENVNLILMSTNEPAAAERKRAERLGVSRFFVKPFEIERLVLAVEQLLSEGYRQFKREYDHVLSSMKALVVALEARDRYTSGHTLRVSRMAMDVGRRLGLAQNELRDLEIASNLHDIGKIGVRDGILLKDGRLTDDEYTQIKEHALIGAEILRPIKSLRKIVPFILYHHERWDGTGYPSGISGEDIPLGARIIAVSDAFDAMTSDRPYRRGMAPERALEIIGQGAGRQFCPVCAAALLDHLRTPPGPPLEPSRPEPSSASKAAARPASPSRPRSRP